jgi:hypothetical protein
VWFTGVLRSSEDTAKLRIKRIKVCDCITWFGRAPKPGIVHFCRVYSPANRWDFHSLARLPRAPFRKSKGFSRVLPTHQRCGCINPTPSSLFLTSFSAYTPIPHRGKFPWNVRQQSSAYCKNAGGGTAVRLLASSTKECLVNHLIAGWGAPQSFDYGRRARPEPVCQTRHTLV